ncbi:MAG TPA: c-type cytochrome [Verrucomicrobiae bacterium]|nr:c-type cytochrome [Verrucomicrobiae bacterium]
MKTFTRASIAGLAVAAAWSGIARVSRPARLAATPGKADVRFGDEGPACPMRKVFGVKDEPSVRGKALYASHCGSCHGANGDGRGPAAVFLYPRPRDFTAGQFKIRSTASGMPTDEDLFGVITAGMPGSSMPAFEFLAERDRRDLIAYVKQLSAKEEDGRRINHFAENPAGSSIPMPAVPDFTPELAAKGARVYASLDCANCHGPTGAGDGPQSVGMKDAWGGQLKPRSYSRDRFVGGDSPEAIYMRIAAGIGGTPMNAYPDSRISPQDRWALVAHILALRKAAGGHGVGQADDGTSLLATRCEGTLPTDPADAAWNRAAQHAVMVNPVWRKNEPTRYVSVRGLHDGKRLAMLLEWASASPTGSAALRVQDFADSAAVQFSLTDRPGFLGMGDPFHPVNLWQWRAAVPKEDPLAQMAGIYPQRKRDIYPGAGGQYFSAAMAGNPLAGERRSTVEEANASGFGTLSVQPAAEQDLAGSGAWVDGRWRVVFTRLLVPMSRRDANLSPGRRVPLALAIWDGRNGDRNGQKNVSAWHVLEVEK